MKATATDASIRKVARTQDFAWELRFYTTDDGKRKLRVQTFDNG